MGICFGILVDDSKDVSRKEQMALVLRYVNKEGELIERFIGLVHVKAVAKKHHDVNKFFDILANVLNVVGGSYKRREMLRDDQDEKLDKLLVLGEIVHILGVLANEGSNYQEKALAKSLRFFGAAIDLQLSELNRRFSEVNTSLVLDLSYELDNYIDYVREMDNAFSNLKRLGDLSKTLVKTDIHKSWGLVYLLVKLRLILHVATATVERAFSSMKFIKNDL
ncbi:PREDICTED: uncharacterized protein LOC109236001 [Nicotiana attenuata]|uniref:uncharacterized protein LOC109236001 n=1 Tax=Nicotiana attenuata TaxID=49451 RepID=UPI000905D60D|nr:PREDICTED: uncharacterized protein LOC109236001 [Nicotiana attenuata]